MYFVNSGMVDRAAAFVNLPGSMTVKTRNRLVALFILAFPFAVFGGFLIHELNSPQPPVQSQVNGRNEATNAAPPSPSAGTNVDSSQPR